MMHTGVCVALLHYNSEYDLCVLTGHRNNNVIAWPGFLQLPGGKCDNDECADDAVLREVEEECNVLLDVKRLICLGGMQKVMHPTGYQYNLTLYSYWMTKEETNYVMNLEIHKNDYWTWSKMSYLLKNNFNNVLPGFYETLRSI